MREILTTALHYKWRILLACSVPIIACVGAAFLLTPQYRADSKVLVRIGRENLPQAETPGAMATPPQSTMQETLANEVEIATGTDLLRDVVRRVGQYRLYPALAAGAASEAAAVKSLREDVVVAPVKLADVIEVSVRNTDRLVALETLAAFLDGFAERHAAAFRRSRIGLVQSEFSAAQDELEAAERDRAAYATEQGLFSVAEQRSVLIQQRERDADAWLSAEVEQAATERALRTLRRQLDGEPVTVTLSATDQDAPGIAEAKLRAQALREQQQQLSQQAGGSLLLAPTKAALASADFYATQLRARTSSATTGPNTLAVALKSQIYAADATLAPLGIRIDRMRGAVTEVDEKLAALSEGEVHLLTLNRRVEQLAAMTSVLSERLVDARFVEDLDQAHVANLQIIERPTAALKPVFPVKRLLALGGIVLGLAAGFGTLLLCLTFSDRLMTADTVQRVLSPEVTVALAEPSRRAARAVRIRLSGPTYP